MDWRHIVSTCATVLVLAATSANAADAPSVKLALSFRPVHNDIVYDIPKEAEYANCKVNVERGKGSSGWIVVGPDGQTLRRYVDTNADNVVDQWRYFAQGLEVYRDIDSNFNNKVDQSRWLNTGGSRWGIDTNEDGRIDKWQILSAEEASREAVLALVARDEGRLASVLVNTDDLTAIGVSGDLRNQLETSVAKPGDQMQAVLKNTKLVNPQTRWTRFDNSTLTPSVIPADGNRTKQDLMVYQSAMAMVENGGQAGLLQIGEMVRINDVWKLTQVPRPIEGNSVTTTGILMQPVSQSSAPTGTPATGAVSEAMRELLTELQKLDQASPATTASRSQIAEYNRKRADLLQRIVASVETDEEREQWMRQLIDGIAAAVQTGAYPDGLTRLQAMDAQLQKQDRTSELAAYARYRLVLAEYTKRITEAGAEERPKVQQWWLEQLENYVKTYPKTNDAADALLQLAITQEFGGKLADAEKWYRRLVADHATTAAGERARGALARFTLAGKPLVLSGPALDGRTIDASTLKGRVVLVIFWATWCKPCTEDLPQIKQLYEKYRSQGFEIVGVNLDSATAPIQPYLSEHRVTWPHIYEPGGLESRLAKQYGIISLPTMFLVDKQGKVVNRNTSVADLKTELPTLFK